MMLDMYRGVQWAGWCVVPNLAHSGYIQYIYCSLNVVVPYGNGCNHVMMAQHTTAMLVRMCCRCTVSNICTGPVPAAPCAQQITRDLSAHRASIARRCRHDLAGINPVSEDSPNGRHGCCLAYLKDKRCHFQPKIYTFICACMHKDLCEISTCCCGTLSQRKAKDCDDC